MATESVLDINPSGNANGYSSCKSSDLIVIPDGGVAQRLGAALVGSAAGVSSLTAGTGISLNASTGAVTVTNTGATAAQGALAATAVQPNTTPTLTGINVGSTSTTLTEASAGDVAVEGNLIYRAGGTDVPLTDGGTGASSAAAARTSLGLSVDAIEFVIDGGGSAITTGVKGDLQIPFGCTITSATLLADQSGSIVVNVWKDTYANYPPTVADKITASAPPTISSATKSTDSTLTGWTTTITAGDTLRFNVDSIATITRVTLILGITK